MPEPSERIAELRRELESNSASRQFYQLGELLRRAGRAAEATSVLRSGLGHHPRYVAAWVSLGRACLDRGLPRDAATALHEALELDPHNPVAWRLLGEARLGDGDRFGALDAMQHALQLAPGDDVLRAAVASLSSETWPPSAAMKLESVEPFVVPTPPTRPVPAARSAVEPVAEAVLLPEPVAATPLAPPPAVAAMPAAPPQAVARGLEDPFAVVLPSAGAAMANADVFAPPLDAAGFADEPFGRAPEPAPAQQEFLADFFASAPVASPIEVPAPIAAAVELAVPVGAAPEGVQAFAEAVPEPIAEASEETVVAEAGSAAAPEEALALPLDDLAATSAFAAAPLESAFPPEAVATAAESPWAEAPPAVLELPNAAEAALGPDVPLPAAYLPAAESTPVAAREPVPMPVAAAVRPTVTLARLHLQQQDFPAAIAILERVVTADPDNQEARDLLDLVHDMMAPLPGELPSLSARERRIAALQGWLASLTLGQERMAR